MKIFYGYDDKHYINVTSVIFEKCFHENTLVIPSGERERSDIIGFDPYPNILKHILVVDYNKNYYRFHHNQECRLSFDSVIKQLQQYNLKDWWKSVGKYISDPNERVKTFFGNVKSRSDFKVVSPIQVMIAQFLKEDGKVLEIGGGIGQNSLLIGTILEDSSKYIILEPDRASYDELKQNLGMNQLENVVVDSNALSYKKLLQTPFGILPLSEVPQEEQIMWHEAPSNTVEQLVEKYNISFNTIISTCNNQLYYILKDNPSVLDNIELLIMENNYKDMDQKQMVDAILYLKGFTRSYHARGGQGPCYDFFYEVWAHKRT